MKAFFVFGITDFQDMMTSIINFSKTEKIWIVLFNCLFKKSQFFYYKKEEIISFVKSTLIENGNLENAKIDFYDLNEKEKYEKDFNNKKIDVVLIQGISHKYPKWLPVIGNTPVVHYAWGADGVNNINKSLYKRNIRLNVLRHPEDENLFKKTGIDSQYFGNFWIESIQNFKKVGYRNIIPDQNKILFMPETWLFHNNKKWDPHSVQNMIDPVIDMAQKNNYFVIVKKREKGHPVDKECGYTNLIKSKPNMIIEKDLFFPSSLYLAPFFANKIIIIGQNTQGTHSMVKTYNFFNSKDRVLYTNKKDYCFKKIENFCKQDNNSLKFKSNKNVTTSIDLLRYINEHIC